MEWVLGALPWLLFVTSVAAQSQCLSLTSQFPACVAGCITTGAISIGCTNTLDLSCQCNSDSSAAIQAYAAGCATSACWGDAGAIVDGLDAGTSVCDCVTSAASKALQLVPVTDSYEAGSTETPQFGCGGCNDNGGLSPPPYSNTWSPASSNTQVSYAHETADAEIPTESYGDDQDVGWCERTKVVTVVHTTTSASSWTPPAWSSPHSSSWWSFPGVPFETVDSSNPYDTQMPVGDDSDDQPKMEDAGPCFRADLAGLSSCSAVCYEDAARHVGCASYDYQCHCQKEPEGSFHDFFDNCAKDCGGSDNTVRAEEFLSQACDCLSTSDAEDSSSHSSKGGVSEDNIVLVREAPQPQDASLACARGVALAQENCTSLAKEVMPSCAQECYLSIASDVGCGEFDFPCQCKEDKRAELTTMMMPCVLTACGFNELPSVIDGGSSVCSCASATGGQAIWEHQEAGAPAPTPAPEQAAPEPEPEKMAAPSTTCEVVTGPAADCAAQRPTFAPCGRDCLSPVVPEAGCGINDFSCLCAPDKQAALSTLVLPRVRESCGDPSAVAIQWDASLSESSPFLNAVRWSRLLSDGVCACASGGSTSTTCYGTSATTTSSSTSTRMSNEDDEETASLQGAADRYGFGILVGVVTAVFVAAIAL